MIITLQHLAGVRGFNVRPGFCRRGARAWFARHGLNWSRFRHQGLHESQFLAVGDALALALVNHAREQAGEQNDGR